LGNAKRSFLKNRKLSELRKFYHPIIIRRNAADDVAFQQVFLTKNYQIGELGFKPRSIVDVNAYVGYSSMYFNSVYPEARIACIEANASNFATLQKNTQYIPAITRFTNCLWSEAAEVQINDLRSVNQGIWIERTANETPTKSITIDQILNDKNWKEIDILKIDLSGSGIDVFVSNFETWIHLVRIFILENSNHWKTGTLDIFLKSIKDLKFKKTQCGQSIVFIKEEEEIEEFEEEQE